MVLLTVACVLDFTRCINRSFTFDIRERQLNLLYEFAVFQTARDLSWSRNKSRISPTNEAPLALTEMAS